MAEGWIIYVNVRTSRLPRVILCIIRLPVRAVWPSGLLYVHRGADGGQRRMAKSASGGRLVTRGLLTVRTALLRNPKVVFDCHAAQAESKLVLDDGRSLHRVVGHGGVLLSGVGG